MYLPRLTHRESIDLRRAVLRMHQMSEPESER